ncbi:MAG: sterol-binding protein, partial [Gammaproteobacteria bacterium]|nr:sterol-binding protein [Gammaproteobacteria bacterium]
MFGDPVGHEVGRVLRGAFAWQRRVGETLLRNSAEYFQEESRLLPVRSEVEGFLNAVDGLRADVDRLSARVQRLRARFPV